MKALILKDLYNVVKYIKSMIFMILIFAVIFTFSKQIQGLVTISSILFGMMILNTYTFDDMCNWERYCLSTPITKKDIVISKFIVLFLLSLLGIIVGFVATIVSLIYMGESINIDFLMTMGILTVISLSIAEIFGSTIIPLVYKFGVEKARSLMVLSYLIPMGIGFCIYQVLLFLGVKFTEVTFFYLVLLSPIIAIVWNILMYFISLKFFEKKEF